MSESLVDLLLVRLGREEEKRKVLKLLVTNLDLSVDDAEKAVESSPSVIREAVPMAEARVIQKDLYPYIDLLPRFEDDSSDDSGTIHEEIRDVSRPSIEEEEEEDVDFDEEDAEDAIEDDHDETEEEFSPDPVYMEPHQEEEESVVVTTASDEIRTTTRCHICGRTPVDGERLAPCRTCGDLTCKDCFDRVAHVCNKCAASGKSVEHANDGVSVESEQDSGLVFDSDMESRDKEKKPSGFPLVKVLVTVVVLIALAAGFYFLDPLGMFAEPVDDPALILSAGQDTTGASQEDTLTAVPDSLNTVETPDTTETGDSAGFDDPFAIRRLELAEEYSSIQNPPEVQFRTTVPRTVEAQVLRQESDLMRHQLSVLAAWIPVTLDDAVLLSYNDSTSVLVIVIEHPVETETRMELMRRTADWLTPSNIDQLVLIYRENRFQNTAIWSLVSEVFQDVQGVLNPSMFQNLLSYREECWESISGPVTDWLIED